MRLILFLLLVINAGFWVSHMVSDRPLKREHKPPRPEINPAVVSASGISLHLADEIGPADVAAAGARSAAVKSKAVGDSREVPFPRQRASDLSGTSPEDFALPNSQCVKVASISTGEAAKEMRRRIAEFVHIESVEEEELPGEAIHWVYIPPRNSATDARSTAEKLRRRGIDAFVIGDDGALLNGISLGVFHERESALRMRSTLVDLEYPVEILSSVKFRKGYSVQGRLLAPSSTAPRRKLETIVRDLEAGATLHFYGCHHIVSPGELN